MKKVIYFYLLVFVMLVSFANSLQAQTQTLRGTITDKQSAFPLIGATVRVMDTDPIIGTITDENGRFELKNVPVGRQVLQVQYLGYETLTLPNILVTAGKEVVLDVSLTESIQSVGEIVVTAKATKDETLNDMVSLSARTFDLEEVVRFSGGRNDVARLAGNFAGVSTADDSRNDIVIRGNSPTGVLWRLEGIPIPNPNHFATLGTTGGPVSALNTNLLQTSDFITSAFPAEYGNALAGVFDLGFRSGNKENYEFTLQMAAFSGLEAMAEGPLNRAKNASFLVSYRYAFTGLLGGGTGTSAIPNYQDLSFKLDFGNGKAGRFILFGLGGLSDIDFLGDDIDENDLFANPNQDAFATSRVGVLGLSHTIFLDKNTYLKTILGTSFAQTLFNQDNYIGEGQDRTKFRATEADDRQLRYTLSSYLNKKFSARFTLRTGVLIEYTQLSTQVDDRDNRPDLDNDGLPDWTSVRDFDGGLPLYQVFAQGQFRFSDQWTLNLGLHGQYLSLNDSYALEPRAGLSWQFHPRQRLSLGYGWHSQAVPLPILLYEEEIPGGIISQANRNLDFIRSHHFVLGYDWKLGQNWRIKAETYYQYLNNVPVEALASSYSILNEGRDFTFEERGSLVNEGKGFNYGLEITVEKFFSEGFYLLLTTSLFDSRYEGSDGVERNTAFNNQYVLNILAGKEFKIGRDKRHALTLDTRFTTAGGRYYTPIDLEATRANNGREVLREDLAFSEQQDPYLRLDVKFGFRYNAKNRKISHQFFVDLQNISNQENIFTQRYNEVTDEINEVNQIGFFPDFMYRLQF
ncbi:MAG: TonB-dependent receptor [Microscillaceae bacterium]|nr:TonB-dependent receptor [Microscillaceae bacterium]